MTETELFYSAFLVIVGCSSILVGVWSTVVYLWLCLTVAPDQITAVIQQHVIPPAFFNKTWCAELLKKLEADSEKYSPWHWYPCFPSTPLSDHRRTHRGVSISNMLLQYSLISCVCMFCLPDKVSAVRAVRRLSQVGGHELVSIDLMDTSSDGALSPAGTDPLSKHPFFIVIGSWSWRVKRKTSVNNNHWVTYLLANQHYYSRVWTDINRLFCRHKSPHSNKH